MQFKDIKDGATFIFKSRNFWKFIAILGVIYMAFTFSFGCENGKPYFKVTPINSPFTKCQ